jgi:uncharacterized membrane protein HdeD (DUF308 family)
MTVLGRTAGRSEMTVQEIADLRLKLQTAVRKHWKALLIEGILLVVLGLAAMVVPALASLAVTILLGWLFLIGGLVELALLIWTQRTPGFWWSLLSSVLAAGAGIVLIARPIQGTLTLTLVLGAYFAAEGVVTIMYALLHRREPSLRWGWLVASGILDLAVAGVIIAGLPGSARWALGLLVGVDLVFGGFALIGMALAGRKIDGIPTNCGWGQVPPIT